jgi:hypothetical protein
MEATGVATTLALSSQHAVPASHVQVHETMHLCHPCYACCAGEDAAKHN